MHKHFFVAASLPHNLLQEIEKNWDRYWHRDYKRLYEESTGKPIEGSVLDDKAIRLLSHVMSIGALDERRGVKSRHAKSRLTGEWIVYAVENSKNFYVTLGVHSEEANGLLSLAIRCWQMGQEFPFVRNRLAANGFKVEIDVEPVGKSSQR